MRHPLIVIMLTIAAALLWTNRLFALQTPAPYRSEPLSVTNGTVTLSGTLTVPQGPGPFPAVVLITGSGPQNRDEEVAGFRVFGVLADHLTRNGIAVFRHDDRGVGQSTGRLAASTTADFADDALVGVTRLAAMPEIDPARIGLIGHSEGGAVAAIAAAKSSAVKFIVMLAGPASPATSSCAGKRPMARRRWAQHPTGWPESTRPTKPSPKRHAPGPPRTPSLQG